ncbi:methyltransferase [Alicyclobacillus contaminans]|uniref:MgtC/SapB family protein n=1 Tax=Alicyclobacillus contaminans TaxID=392016 RepID=UPI0003FD157B|nr:MgtC/SapB family protein [Alicyclobacillus contaminans]GMA49748.1 methyltransferase [Alicyclobacillus contaminans]
MFHHDVLKIVVAALLGILVGLERELKRKPLGLKTCLVISVTSCLLTIVSIDAAMATNAMTNGVFRADPMRLAAQIVSGIGFLGAGVILRKNNEVISGLTTAAMVWASSGLGIAVGAGYYVDAVTGLLLIIVSVDLVPFVLRRVGPRVLNEKEVEIHLVVERHVTLSDILTAVQVLEAKVERIRTNKVADGTKELKLTCIVHVSVPLMELYSSLEALDGVVSMSTTLIH